MHHLRTTADILDESVSTDPECTVINTGQVSDTEATILMTGTNETLHTPMEAEKGNVGGDIAKNDVTHSRKKKKGSRSKKQQKYLGGKKWDKAIATIKDDLDTVKQNVQHLTSSLSTLIEEQHKTKTAITHIESSCEISLGRTRNVVIHGIPEPYQKSGRLRDKGMRYFIGTILRVAGIPGHVGLKRVLRLGKWLGVKKSPRPVMIEFANPRYRDQLLSRADRVHQNLGGVYNITPDYLATTTSQRTRPVTQMQTTFRGATPTYRDIVVRTNELPHKDSSKRPTNITGNSLRAGQSTSRHTQTEKLVRREVTSTPISFHSRKLRSTPETKNGVSPQV